MMFEAEQVEIRTEAAQQLQRELAAVGIQCHFRPAGGIHLPGLRVVPRDLAKTEAHPQSYENFQSVDSVRFDVTVGCSKEMLRGMTATEVVFLFRQLLTLLEAPSSLYAAIRSLVLSLDSLIDGEDDLLGQHLSSVRDHLQTGLGSPTSVRGA